MTSLPASPPANDHNDALFARARAGDSAAWDDLFRACYPKVIRVVRRRLDRPLRSLYDSTDFASDVMKSLAANADRLDFPSFDSLMAFLAQVAEQKVIDEYRRLHTLKRDIHRQRPLSGHDPDRPGLGAGLASPSPTASQFAQADEAHERLLRGKSDPEREAILLKEEGYSPSEIANRTGWSLRSVQRFFQNLHESFLRTDRSR